MKRLLPISNTLLVFAVFIFFSGCFKDKITKSYTLYRPVYASKSSVLENISSNQPRAMEAPGKIFILGRYIFANEVDKGVHVIDNIDPANPRPVVFIDIPGNLDIAVKGTTLYADMYTDLVAVDISDPLNAKFIKNVPGVFPDRSYVTMPYDTSFMIVGWETKDTMMDVEPPTGITWRGYFAISSMDMASGSKNTFVPGIAGSMSRFSIVNDYLFAVNHSALHSFDISDPASPNHKGATQVGWNIETLYPFGGKLFIGSNVGMFIYDIDDPANPKAEGTFSHATACDPVIADGNNAFVTLRTGTACNSTSNQLDVLDVTNVQSPTLIKSYNMTNPAGLAKDGDVLFLCDGADGLKVFDASNVRDIDLIDHIPGLETYDVIAWDKLLLVVAREGLFQYDYTDPSALRLLSSINVKRK